MWLIEYKDLIENLVLSDLKVKYKNSILGFGWSILNPLFTMIILVFVFSNMLRVDIENFPVFLLCGLTCWRFFANGTISSLWSLIGKSHIVKKIYFPREILVLSVVLSNMISIILEFIVFFIILILLIGEVHKTIILFPLILLLEFILVFGIGLFLAIATVYFRDLVQIWEITLQAGFFLTPTIYSVSMIPPEYLPYYLLNPMTRLMEMYRSIFMYGVVPKVYDLAVVGISCIVIFAIGFLFFKKFEPRVGEVV
ncbi:ABC transporter permease [Candidatus Altiarchaeota archaeon]